MSSVDKPDASADHGLPAAPADPSALLDPRLRGVRLVHDDGRRRVAVTVPGRDPSDGERLLSAIGEGGLGTGLDNTYLGLALPRIRAAYYQALGDAEREIAQRQAELGAKLDDPAAYKAFVEWASNKRTSIARLWRLPAGPGAVIGGEVRDNLKYGLGGRSFENLVRRNAERGMTEEKALGRLLTTVDKPNPAATEAILRGSKFLRGGGVLFIVGGLAVSGYEVYEAKPQDRPEVLKREATITGASLVGSDVAVGVAILLGASGIGLIAIGLVAGVAAAYGAEKLYYARQHSVAMQGFRDTGLIHAGAMTRRP